MKLTDGLDRVRGRYCEDHAELTLSVPGTRYSASYDEGEVDAMLRVIECSLSPEEDLTELFEGEFGSHAYRVAELITSNAVPLARLVYA